jgi:adenylate cyclase
MAVPSTTQARIELKRHENEEWVLAKNAALGEKTVAIGRIILLVMLFGSQQVSNYLMGAERPPQDFWRILLIATYGVYATVSLYAVLTVSPARLIRARTAILIVVPLIDFGFSLAMNLRLLAVMHESAAQRLAPFLAVMLATSVLRSSRRHVVYATTLAVLAYSIYLAVSWWTVPPDRVSGMFILGALIGEGAFLYQATSLVRRMLLDFEKIESVSRFLPPSVARKLRDQGEATLQPATREVTILFSDLRDFTTMSEKLPPTELMAFLTDYFARMQQVVYGHDGVVNKLMGDGMLAMWGAPDPDPDHAKKAVAAALDMRKVLAEMNVLRAQQGKAPIHSGVGLHSGNVAAGLLGGEAQHEYAVIGDTVNLASRIEGLTKSLGTDILASETTWARLGGSVPGRTLGPHSVKGREQQIVVYAVDGKG